MRKYLGILILVYAVTSPKKFASGMRVDRGGEDQGLGAGRGVSVQVEETRSVLSQKPSEGYVSTRESGPLCKCC